MIVRHSPAHGESPMVLGADGKPFLLGRSALGGGGEANAEQPIPVRVPHMEGESASQALARMRAGIPPDRPIIGTFDLSPVHADATVPIESQASNNGGMALGMVGGLMGTLATEPEVLLRGTDTSPELVLEPQSAVAAGAVSLPRLQVNGSGEVRANPTVRNAPISATSRTIRTVASREIRLASIEHVENIGHSILDSAAGDPDAERLGYQVLATTSYLRKQLDSVKPGQRRLPRKARVMIAALQAMIDVAAVSSGNAWIVPVTSGFRAMATAWGLL